MSQVYNIPAHYPFLETLAQGLLDEVGENTEKLIDIKILLPTRRACRNLRDTFLRLTKGEALLLPLMQPVSDLDADELDIMLSGLNQNTSSLLDIPPALSPLRRYLLLAAQIRKVPNFAGSMTQSIKLAIALGQLMDQIYNEDLDLADLYKLVPEDFATHWQITIKFLEIVSLTWPEILKSHGAIDAADRRNKILRSQKKLWQTTPPKGRIIAAGIIGSVPAVADLLDVIRTLPQGEIILPAFNDLLDEESWKNLEETHPDHAFYTLLHKLEIKREDVSTWPLIKEKLSTDDSKIKSILATEIMRPAVTTHKWQQLAMEPYGQDLKQLISGDTLQRLECETSQEEATLISIIMREAVENPDKTCALITADRHLARRVSSALKRWNINVDDSGGFNLAHSKVGSFLLLTMQACKDKLSPISLLSLLTHNLTTGGGELDNFRSLIRLLEKRVLRGPKPDKPNIEGVRQRIKQKRTEQFDPISDEDADHIEALLQNLDPILNHLTDSIDTPKPLKSWLEKHLTLAEALCSTKDHSGAEILWRGEDGGATAAFLSELYEQASHLGNITADEYYDILEHFMKAQMIRPNYGTHPRLIILGLMEARLYKADRIILAGLNEKIWPPEVKPDMWMSRPMRQQYGLPDPDRIIGQAAHDFIGNFCAPEIFMTRSKKMDNSPAVPSRWWQRMDTIFSSLDIDIKNDKSNHYDYMTRSLLHSDTPPSPCERPQPKPPIRYRPNKLSVTAIEKWMMDPYTIYARHILKLKKLKPLEENVDAAEKGSIMHEIFDKFITAHPDKIPQNAENIILQMAHDTIGQKLKEPAMENFWWPRFIRLASWFVENEHEWRKEHKPLKTEVSGQLKLQIDKNHFTITARADRIDLNVDGTYAIIDYKTGTPPSKEEIKRGAKPQLSLEAGILLKAGYQDINAGNIGYIGAWKMSGGYPQAERKDLFLSNSRYGPNDLADTAVEGLKNLVKAFNDENTPYISFPNLPDQIPPSCQDYVHLARVKEWADGSATGEV